MKILITGASGFLGSLVARRLEREDVEMALLLRASSDLWRLEPTPKNARIIRGELQDLPATEIKSFGPDIVIHAAWHGVASQKRNDAAQVEQNLSPTLRLVELAHHAGARGFVGLGSQAEYGPLNRKISESDLTNPTALYGATKLAACHLTRQLCAQAGMRWVWLRVFSTYGPKEDPSWMIPYLARSLLRGERPALTACEQRWDFLFGADAAEAIWAAARTEPASGIFNLGTGRTEPLRKIVETLRDEINPSLPLGIGEVPYRPDQVMHLEADITRLMEATGWRPITPLDKGIRETIAWHKAQMQK